LAFETPTPLGLPINLPWSSDQWIFSGTSLSKQVSPVVLCDSQVLLCGFGCDGRLVVCCVDIFFFGIVPLEILILM